MQSKDFKKLQETWYKKLEKSGFKDIELHDQHDNIKIDPVKDNVTWKARKYKDMLGYDPYSSVNAYNAKVEYFQLAGTFSYEYKFETKKDKFIWQYHCEGKTMPEIVELLKKHNIKIQRSRVNQIVLKLADIMLKLNKDNQDV